MFTPVLLVSRVQRQGYGDARALPGLRVDYQATTEIRQSLADVQQAEPADLVSGAADSRRVESDAIVLNAYLRKVRFARIDYDFHFVGTGMLDDIPQQFLCRLEQQRAQIVSERRRNDLPPFSVPL